MCNACGNVCCGSDEFGGCGCDGCSEPDCWSDDEEFFGDDDEIDFCSCRRSTVLLCVEVGGTVS